MSDQAIGTCDGQRRTSKMASPCPTIRAAHRSEYVRVRRCLIGGGSMVPVLVVGIGETACEDLRASVVIGWDCGQHSLGFEVDDLGE